MGTFSPLNKHWHMYVCTYFDSCESEGSGFCGEKKKKNEQNKTCSFM